ncbi:MAG TPA: hypothetical protein VH277_11160 [Gemmatimonadaceae bacterium]|nr:hypothetical protein [Gemmatimonadaceae bacterium]
MALSVGLVSAGALRAQQPRSTPSQNRQRLQGTRDMHVACVGPDSGRTFRRGVGGDSLSRASTPPAGTAPITGGTERSHEFPEYDVVLDIPNLCVERIFLKVDSLTAHIALNAQVSNLVRISAGADVLIGNVDLTIQDVRARALLLVDLDDVVHIVDQTLTFIDNHPEVVSSLTGTIANAGGAVGGLVGNVVGAVQGLLLSTSNLANGNVLQHVVDQATGSLIDKTLSSAGKVLAQKTVGSILNLPTLKETTNTAGQVVRQVKDQAGNLIEYTLDKATNKLAGVRLLK